jgi:hypothetical protein
MGATVSRKLARTKHVSAMKVFPGSQPTVILNAPYEFDDFDAA